MIEVMAAVSLANSAFNALKSGLEKGKELQDVHVSQLPADSRLLNLWARWRSLFEVGAEDVEDCSRRENAVLLHGRFDGRLVDRPTELRQVLLCSVQDRKSHV